MSKVLINFVKSHKLILSLTLCYFVLRLINLTLLPIFNDEAIYLDWGWRETHRVGFLYYSLYDAKQPLLMWIFGIAENIISDPLFAGRFISVLAGFLTLLGIYEISKDIFDKKVGIIAALFYSVIPLFSFYDRQALMESSVASVGIWAFYFLEKSLSNQNSKKFPILLGAVLGIGFFIKSSTLLFVCSAFFILLIYAIFSKKTELINALVISILVFLASISALLINPQFWQTLPTNARYSLTFSELSSFPFQIWAASFIDYAKIVFVYLTPVLLATSLLGIVLILLKKDTKQLLFLTFFTLSLLATVFLTRIPSDRYLVSFLPFLVIPAALFAFIILKKQRSLGILSVFVITVIPFLLTLLQIFSPAQYLLTTMPYAPSVNSTYLTGNTSGYGINETIDYLKKASGGRRMIIGIAENTGNPESALIDYFNSSANVQTVYFAPESFPASINDYDCLIFDAPVYFVTRDQQLPNLAKFFYKIETINNPYGKNTIGIYAQKSGCTGKSLRLHAGAS